MDFLRHMAPEFSLGLFVVIVSVVVVATYIMSR